MGEVYLAEDTLLGREVAVKRLLPIFAEDEEFVTRFKHEARAISGLVHPGLVRVHSLDWVNGVLLLDMEFVRGTSLLRTLQNSVVTPQFTARLAYEVLDALVECHENGIVHRDIKPSNILLTETQRAKLVDFGIATALADSSATQLREGRSTTVVLGTPRFMPPEAWDGGQVSPQWDLFALGVVLYECLTGSAAFKGTTTAALAKQITNDPLPGICNCVPNLSAPLANLVDQLVLIDPSKRCASARDALVILEGAPELQASVDGSTIRRSARKTLSRVLAQRGVRKSPRISRWAAAVALAAVAATGMAIYAAMPRQTLNPTQSPQNQEVLHPAAQSPTSDLFLRASRLGSEGEENWHWWIAPAAADGTRAVVAYSAQAVLRMTMSESPDGAKFDGNWSGFGSPLGRGFEQGSVIGGGRWEQGRRAMAATLEFASSSQRTNREVSFLIEPEADISTREKFMRGLEGSPLIPTLVFRELMPRNSSLSRSITELFPAVGQRIDVPLLNDDQAPLVDGKLDESTWREPVYDVNGRIGELAKETGGRVMARQTSDGLFMGFRTPSIGGSSIKTHVGILLGVMNPPGWAPRGIVEASETSVIDRKYFAGESEAAFPQDWQIAVGKESSDWVMEIFVPFDGQPTAPWRFNCNVERTDASGKSSHGVIWGDADVNNLAHGALLIFRNAGS